MLFTSVYTSASYTVQSIEFTRLVYGPTCAYTQIRTVFPTSPDEVHAGFEMPKIYIFKKEI